LLEFSQQVNKAGQNFACLKSEVFFYGVGWNWLGCQGKLNLRRKQQSNENQNLAGESS
jgi:hypothetical protein